MSKKKLLIILGGALLLVFGATAAYAVVQFTDIAGTTHEDSIIWAVDNGITVGYADNTFRPNNPTTRGQMTTFLNRFYNNLVKPLENGGPSIESTCGQCHDETDLISSKQAQWENSLHGSGEVFLEDGSSTSCQGCHSGGAFSNLMAAGLSVNTTGTANPPDNSPSRQDCRACHQIHETGTAADWALETVAPVNLFATPGSTFDGGAGNLCANCHQARRIFPAGTSATVTGITTHWGPHHGPQSDMLLGLAGANATGGALTGAPMAHYNDNSVLGDTCVSCHVADPASHTFDPKVDVCQECHTTEDFNVGNEQTEVKARLDALATQLAAAGLLTITSAPGESPIDGHPAVTEAPRAQAAALFNWLYLAHEDKSFGVHNPGYTNALLDAAEAALAD